MNCLIAILAAILVSFPVYSRALVPIGTDLVQVTITLKLDVSSIFPAQPTFVDIRPGDSSPANLNLIPLNLPALIRDSPYSILKSTITTLSYDLSYATQDHIAERCILANVLIVRCRWLDIAKKALNSTLTVLRIFHSKFRATGIRYSLPTIALTLSAFVFEFICGVFVLGLKFSLGALALGITLEGIMWTICICKYLDWSQDDPFANLDDNKFKLWVASSASPRSKFFAELQNLSPRMRSWPNELKRHTALGKFAEELKRERLIRGRLDLF